METRLGRRLYLSALLSAIVALAVVRLFAIPRWDADPPPNVATVVAATTDSLIGAAFASLAVSFLLIVLFERGERLESEAETVPAKAIGPLLKESARTTMSWNYRGRTGRYFRSNVLPILAARAEEQGQYINISVQLINPDDLKAVEFFVEYRRLINPTDVGYWTACKARAEIAATVTKIALLSASHSRLEIRLFFSSLISPYTLDVSNDIAVLSRATQAALKYAAGSTFYDSTLEDLRLGFRQSHPVSTDSGGVTNVHSKDELGLLLDRLGVLSNRDDTLLEATLKALHHPFNPYGI